MDTSHMLAQNIVDIRYEDLPPQVIKITKNSILDTIGVILAANTLGEGGVKEIIQFVMEEGGKAESIILGFGYKAPSWMAAFANGSMAHQLDYDDCFDIGIAHPSGPTVPAALAIAGRQNNITGKDFITAVALGIDVVCRLSLPLTKDNTEYGWARTSSLGKYGAVSAAGKLLSLNKSQMVSAFGLVLNQASISFESSYTGNSDVRAIRDGFGAKAGVFSALLAQKGLIGGKTSLDGKYGLYNICFHGDSDPAKVIAELGKKFMGVDVSYKPWPCCRQIHGFIEAVLKLVKEYSLKPEDIEQIIAVSGGTRKKYYETLDERRKPKTSIDAKYSLPFVIGVAIVKQDVLLEDFTYKGRNNPTALEIAQKVSYRFDEQYKRPGMEIGLIEMVLKGGRTISKEIPFAYGHPQNPISTQDLFKKFKDCARYSIKSLTGEQIEKIISTLDSLENVSNMQEVFNLLE